jgi:(2Fe-2S) ferredoxin
MRNCLRTCDFGPILVVPAAEANLALNAGWVWEHLLDPGRIDFKGSEME